MVHSERSEIINLKINNFRDNKSTTTKIIRPSINPDVHVNKQNHFIKGSWGISAPRPSQKQRFKRKKINKQNGGFSFKV